MKLLKKLFKKISSHWETAQIPSILCNDKELLRHINYWTRYQRLECGFYSLLITVPFVQDAFLEVYSFSAEENTFVCTAGTLGNKSAIISLLPNEVIIRPAENVKEEHHYQITLNKKRYNGEDILEYRLKEINN
jgi:hypothetical protein